MSNEKVSFNGINARSGSYLFDAMSAEDIVQVALGNSLEKQPDGEHQLRELKLRRSMKDQRTRGVKEGIDAAKLEEAGWGVIFPAAKPGSDQAREVDAIREALSPLLSLRKRQATRNKEHYYKEYVGKDGYRPGESKQKFMGRLGVGIGPADPDLVPYYLLIVGSPQVIPFRVQYQIDVQYAVGRLHFETLEEYDNYARSVVAAETEGLSLPRELAFVGVANPDDMATQLSRDNLVGPLSELAEDWHDVKGWTVTRYLDEAANKATVSELFGGAKTPALIFSASHGMGFDRGDPLQARHQGALLLQDWTGPKQWQGPIDESLYLSADDLGSEAALRGLISFNFACYGGGTPQYDEFSKQAYKQREAIADEAFVSGLHRRMLSHPKGGALAAIGHVERAWGCSFMWKTGTRGTKTPQLAVFESTLKSLMKGMPVGMAVEYFNERYAEMASDLTVQLEDLEFEPDAVEPQLLADMWTSNNDARGYGILGDPAVRLRFADEGDESSAQQSIDLDRASASAAGTASSVSIGGVELDLEHNKDAAALAAALLASLGEIRDQSLPIEVRTRAGSDADASFALTRVALDGSTEAVVEERDGALGPALLEHHQELLEQAQAARNAAIQALLAATKSSD